MRRLTSTLIGAAVAAVSVLSVAAPASAASGDVTETAVSNAVPASPAGLRASRIMRLSRTGEFLVIGRVSSNGTNYHMWQLKPDLSLDTTFGTNGLVDLGVADTAPCSLGNSSGLICSNVNGLSYNEVSNTYFVGIYTNVRTTNNQYQVTRLVTGNLKTGAVTSRVNLRESNYWSSSPTQMAQYESEFAALNIPVTTLAKTECEAVSGTAINGASLQYANTNSYSPIILPSGSIVMSISCNYDNTRDPSGNQVPYSGTYRQYRTSHYAAFKVANNALTLDTSFGTGGRVALVDGKTTCDAGGPGGTTTDLGITTMTSTKPYTMISVSTTPRQTTLPQTWANSGFTAYDGCQTSIGSTVTYSSKVYSMTASGKTTEVLSLPDSSTPFFSSRWVIDPAGRWVTLAQSSSAALSGPNAPNSTTRTFVAIRVKDGKADATFGTNGQKTLSLASNVTIGGVSYPMNYSLTGIITTQDEVFFSGSSSRTTTASGASSFSCTAGTTIISEVRPFIFSMKTGDIVKTYGTDGLGAAASSQYDSADFCGNFGSASWVDSKGRFSLLRARPAIGSQTAGTFAYAWETIAGVTGGGDGGTGTGGATKDTGGAAFAGEKPFSAALAAAPAAGGALTVAGRVDTTVYAKAPAKVEVNSAVAVLKPSEADDLDLVTTTPKVCIALTTSVVFTGTGRCTVRVLDEDTRRVVRSFSTVVTSAETEVGTVLTTDKPIMFGQVRTTLSATARAQVKELAAAATGAGRILVLGHSASLFGNEVSNRRISLERAAAVKRALIAAGVKNPISIVAMGSKDMVNTGKSEAQQAQNRRVEVFIFPVAG